MQSGQRKASDTPPDRWDDTSEKTWQAWADFCKFNDRSRESYRGLWQRWWEAGLDMAVKVEAAQIMSSNTVIKDPPRILSIRLREHAKLVQAGMHSPELSPRRQTGHIPAYLQDGAIMLVRYHGEALWCDLISTHGDMAALQPCGAGTGFSLNLHRWRQWLIKHHDQSDTAWLTDGEEHYREQETLKQLRTERAEWIRLPVSRTTATASSTAKPGPYSAIQIKPDRANDPLVKLCMANNGFLPGAPSNLGGQPRGCIKGPNNADDVQHRLRALANHRNRERIQQTRKDRENR